MNADDTTPAVRNAVSGEGGSVVQAGVVHGGIHFQRIIPATATVVPRQLRPPPAYFTDRAAPLVELDRIVELGERERPTLGVISGPGGVGKTALALRWLHSNTDRYPDGQLYVDLRPDGPGGPVPPSSVLHGFLRALGVPADRIPVDAGEAAGLFRSMTIDKQLAVLVDNAVAAAQVRVLLPASPASLVVVASRSRLAGLVADGARFVRLVPLDAAAGVDLLARTVGDARAAREPEATAALADLCGGFPIALTIAGARLATRPDWSVARVVDALSDEQQRLTALTVEQDLSMSEVFDLSYAELPANAARAYRLLGLHPGPDITVDLACAILRTPPWSTGDVLETLVNANLLDAVSGDRYQFHDLVRLHARQRAEVEDSVAERANVVQRTLEYLVTVCAAMDRVIMPLEWRIGPAFDLAQAPYVHAVGRPPVFTTSEEALDSVEPELPNLMAALRAGVDHRLDDLVWQVCEAAWSLFLYRKHFPDWIAAYQLGIEAATRCGNTLALSRMHHHLGFAFHNLRRSREALEQGRLALAAAQAAEYGRAESGALGLIGMALRELGQVDEAIEVLRHVVRLDHDAGRPRNEALNLRRLGQTLTAAGQVPEAIDELQRARALAVTLQDPPVTAMTEVWLAEALSLDGRGVEAIALLHDAWAVLSTSGSDQYAAHVFMVWGEAAERLGELDTARLQLAQALELFTGIGAPHAERVQAALDRIDSGRVSE